MRPAVILRRHAAAARASALALPLVAWVGAAGAQVTPAEAAKIHVDNTASLKAQNSRLEEQLAAQDKTVAGLRAELAALQSRYDRLQGEYQQAVAAGKGNAATSAEASALQQANTQLTQRLDAAQADLLQARQRLADAQAEAKHKGSDTAALKSELEGERRREATAQATLLKQRAEIEQLEAPRPPQPSRSGEPGVWAALAATVAAALAAGGVRRWWPRQVSRPVTVSASLGSWRLSAPAASAGPSFAVTTHWYPGATELHVEGPLIARSTAAAVEGAPA